MCLMIGAPRLARCEWDRSSNADIMAAGPCRVCGLYRPRWQRPACWRAWLAEHKEAPDA